MTKTIQPPLLDICELALSDRLDASQIGALRRQPEWRTQAAEFRIDLSRIVTIDPVGAALLARLCQDIERRGPGRITLTGLSLHLRQRLRHHPLLRHHGDPGHLFSDPYEVPGASGR